MAIQCGHKKLQGRLQLFGRDFAQVAHGNAEGIPFVIKKCILEIEKRALNMKVSGAGREGGREGERGRGRERETFSRVVAVNLLLV